MHTFGRCLKYALLTIGTLLAYILAVGVSGMITGTIPIVFGPVCVLLFFLMIGTIMSLDRIGRGKHFGRHVLVNSLETFVALTGSLVLLGIGSIVFFLLSKFLFQEIAEAIGITADSGFWPVIIYIIPGMICLGIGSKVAGRIADPILDRFSRWKSQP